MSGKSESGDASDKHIESQKPVEKTEHLNQSRAVSGSELQTARGNNDSIMESVRQLPALQPGMTLEQARQLQDKMDAFGIDYGTHIETAAGVRQKGSAEETGTVIDYEVQKSGKNLYALGMDYEARPDTRLPSEKLSDFVKAAAVRVTDSDGWQKFLDGEVQKVIGIGQGLNIAKEHTKSSVAAGWKALTDGTVANVLSKPNAINDPLFKTLGGALDAMARDPNAVNNALERLGSAIHAASDQYTNSSSIEQGRVLGEIGFFAFNPEGSTEAGELAIKAADRLATSVDKVVENGIRASVKTIQELSATSPEAANSARQLFYDQIDKLGLTPQQREFAGIPRGFFDSIESNAAKGNDFFAMSKADEVGAGKDFGTRKFRDTVGSGEYQIDEATGRLQRTNHGELRTPYKWPVMNERFGGIARQILPDSCISTVGAELSEGAFTEKQLIARLGSPGDIDDLPGVLGGRWTTEKGPTRLPQLDAGGPWVAEFRERAWTQVPKTPHVVIVDGPASNIAVKIRDPLEGTSYEMTLADFKKAWTGRAAYRKVD